MTSFVTSRDGTRIAYDLLGDGPPLIVVSGMFCTRQTTHELSEQLAARCVVVNYDRRGRGESGDTPPYAAEREIDDLAALIDAVGGSAAVYVHSSGAGLALRAAAAGDVVLDHDMAQAVTELAIARRRGPAGRPFAELTQREYDILDLIAQGLDNQAIARRLVLSPKTVRNHVSNVFSKLNVADRSHAIVLGRERGLGQAPG